MRTKKEINDALTKLMLMPDNAARRAQREVLEGGRSESWVFDKYVRNAPSEEKDEDVFYAARDAAQFVAGKLDLDAVLEVNPLDDESEEVPESVTVSTNFLRSLLERVERLEHLMQVRTEIGKKYSGKEELMQAEVCEYLGCAQCTIMRWTQRGIVKAIQRGRNLYYLKSELDNNPAVQAYKKRNNI